MGSGAAFKENKIGTEYFSQDSIAGIKIIQKKNKKKGTPDNTPNTMYAIRDKVTGKVDQVSVYEAISESKHGRKIKDIEWGHYHKPFKKGEVHVQDYIEGIRQKAPRSPTKEELQIVEAVRRM